MFRLKVSSEGCCRSLGDSLGQRYGPGYLIGRFPYLIVEYNKVHGNLHFLGSTLWVKPLNGFQNGDVGRGKYVLRFSRESVLLLLVILS